ncbi:MAG: cytochrome C [Faecousia sp.]
MTVKKIAALMLAAALMLTVTACGEKAAEPTTEAATEATTEATTEAAEPQKAEYTVYNTTGDVVTELYLYLVGSEDKGENFAGEGLEDGDSVVITKEAASEDEAKAMTFVLEFVSGGQTQKYETVHFEVAPISLKSVDAASGATPIAFAKPEA